MKGDGLVLGGALLALGTVYAVSRAIGPNDMTRAALEAVDTLYATPQLQQGMFGKTSSDKKEIMSWMLREEEPDHMKRAEWQRQTAEKAIHYGNKGDKPIALVALVMVHLGQENLDAARKELLDKIEAGNRDLQALTKQVADIAHTMSQ